MKACGWVQVTIWLGVFPIVVSWWAALGLTIYYIATNAVLYYIKSLKHIEALWFANCANQLLFYTYIKVGHTAHTNLCTVPVHRILDNPRSGTRQSPTLLYLSFLSFQKMRIKDVFSRTSHACSRHASFSPARDS